MPAPRGAYTLVKALKEEIGLPVHFHTHDTSGIAAASVLAAVEAGADAVDGAIDAMSGLTSQPNLGSIVEALAFRPARYRASIRIKIRMLSAYWEQVRKLYARVRKRHPRGRLRSVCARYAGRAVHQPA